MRKEGSIVLSMEDYIRGLEEIKDISKADRDKPLTRLELKEDRNMTGKTA